ncbi:D-Ala-D-Ala carboxypeptidase family metallohydrolase [Ruminococcus flavefaciens]|uniref:D-Ala-D-Ala carboxypeptidase family metallohydrolase n=1 Tax=Ruminococcus flavefaciens TaxID=1265 RepID=UPI0026F2B618|nr:D-Ala-D-Ala carboxypeptidase family metallohydrolase [Ruminococcus flavefaciens]MDD7515913.1 D-Ala-D-Ala carboxypeptidase family metallohydrolase [Ruminococcus flavefaciens]MDY5691430.1 D-Ala-D-Ala carboxypeptidase family metallohydrolase [Ruminococcus flavefaciens]
MGNLSPHFDDYEFACSCCGKSIKMSDLLIERLEKMHTLMAAKAIYVNSGYRCKDNPWGSPTDAHRKGMAADIRVQRKDGSWYTAEDIAEAAERVGFKGIGMMEDLSGANPAACHVDTRGDEPYIYDWWHGDESRGIDWTKDSKHTFIRGTVFDGEAVSIDKKEHKLRVYIDDTLIDEHKFSGLLDD